MLHNAATYIFAGLSAIIAIGLATWQASAPLIRIVVAVSALPRLFNVALLYHPSPLSSHPSPHIGAGPPVCGTEACSRLASYNANRQSSLACADSKPPTELLTTSIPGTARTALRHP